MKILKSTMFYCFVLVACAFFAQTSCSRMDQGEAVTGRYRASSEAIQAFWDGNSKEIRLTFPSAKGVLDVVVVNAAGQVAYEGLLDSANLGGVIPFSQAIAGEYTVKLTDKAGEVSSIKISIQ